MPATQRARRREMPTKEEIVRGVEEELGCSGTLVFEGRRVALGEAVEVDTSVYEYSHGRKPKGFGSWAFSFDKKDVSHDKMFWAHQMTYGDALKEAKKEAKKRGAEVIFTQP